MISVYAGGGGLSTASEEAATALVPAAAGAGGCIAQYGGGGLGQGGIGLGMQLSSGTQLGVYGVRGDLGDFSSELLDFLRAAMVMSVKSAPGCSVTCSRRRLPDSVWVSLIRRQHMQAVSRYLKGGGGFSGTTPPFIGATVSRTGKHRPRAPGRLWRSTLATRTQSLR